MIGYLRGTIREIWGDKILLLVENIGYRVTIGNLSSGCAVDQKIELYIHTHVKEDDLSLYGFKTRKALVTYELLIGVSGVGPKMAMGILGHGNAEEIQKAVSMADVSFFTKVKGIGKKNGQRIIVDLKSKMGSLEDIDLSEPDSGIDDVFDALVGMGFDPKRVQRMLKTIDQGLSEQEKIKLAIKQLSN